MNSHDLWDNCLELLLLLFIRWLQPDQSVDPSASDLELVNAKETPMVGKQVQLVVRTRDQEKQIVFVEGMNVSTGLGIGSGVQCLM